MAAFFEALLKFFSEFTWRKLLVVILVGGAVFVLYERYTSSFRLSRLQKATELLARLQDVQTHGTNGTPEWERARTALMNQALQAIEEKPMSLELIPSTLTISIDGFWKFCAGGALWCVFALFQLPKRNKVRKAEMPFMARCWLPQLAGSSRFSFLRSGGRGFTS